MNGTGLGAFHVPSTIVVGGGARREVGPQLKRLEVSRILLVTDEGMLKLGHAGEVIELIRAAGVEVSVFSGVQPDPTDENVRSASEQFHRDRCQAIVAVGGGSPIDAAKAAAALIRNPGSLAAFAGYHQIPRPGVPLLALPTTAGTGSEATKVAVITDTQRDIKMMMLSVHLLPCVALVDYEFTLSMPAPLTAAVGVDTLTHGIEAYVSRKAHGMTDPLALSCIRLCAEHLIPAFQEGTNREARAGMMLAACQGGMAFANSSVCLVHGMSRPIGALFHVPHGLSNAVLLPTVTRYSLSGARARYATVCRLLGWVEQGVSEDEAAAALPIGLARLNATLQLPRLRDCRGVAAERFAAVVEKMATDALASGSPQNNPRVPTAAEIVALYHEAW